MDHFVHSLYTYTDVFWPSIMCHSVSVAFCGCRRRRWPMTHQFVDDVCHCSRAGNGSLSVTHDPCDPWPITHSLLCTAVCVCVYSPLDKCSLMLNRFDDDLLLTADSLQRPEYRRGTRVRGKARAIHTFRAQNNRQVLILCHINEVRGFARIWTSSTCVQGPPLVPQGPPHVSRVTAIHTLILHELNGLSSATQITIMHKFHR